MAEATAVEQIEYRNKRRIKKLRVTWQIVVDMMKHNDAPFRLQVTKNALPEDARCIGILAYDGPARQEHWVALIIQSQSWDEVPDGVEMPVLDAPEVTRIFVPELAEDPEGA